MFVKAMITRKRGLRRGEALPGFNTERNGVSVNAERLAAYRALCGCDKDGTLPILYPYVLSAGLQMYILTRKVFPLRAFGLVHTRNQVVMRRAIAEREILDFRCETGASRVIKSGLEFDVLVTISSCGEVVWENTSTYLSRGHFGDADPNQARPSLPELAEGTPAAEMAIGKDLGRRYARVSGDYNPIHVSSVLAKLFGFPRAIIHGMWSAAACAGRMPKLDGDGPLNYDILFKGPVFLGSRAKLVSASSGASHRFDLYCGSNPKPCLCGMLSRGAQ